MGTVYQMDRAVEQGVQRFQREIAPLITEAQDPIDVTAHAIHTGIHDFLHALIDTPSEAETFRIYTLAQTFSARLAEVADLAVTRGNQVAGRGR